MAVLVTGGAGFIGSQTCVELLQSGYEVLIVDNLANSHEIVIDRIQEITGKKIKFFNVDLLDRDLLVRVFQTGKIDHVIHFAGFKSVHESVEFPLKYYENNVLHKRVTLWLHEMGHGSCISFRHP